MKYFLISWTGIKEIINMEKSVKEIVNEINLRKYALKIKLEYIDEILNGFEHVIFENGWGTNVMWDLKGMYVTNTNTHDHYTITLKIKDDKLIFKVCHNINPNLYYVHYVQDVIKYINAPEELASKIKYRLEILEDRKRILSIIPEN